MTQPVIVALLAVWRLRQALSGAALTPNTSKPKSSNAVKEVFVITTYHSFKNSVTHRRELQGILRALPTGGYALHMRKLAKTK